MKKQTILQQVEAASEQLKCFTTHTQLREWAISQGFDNRAAFPAFKKALLAIGIDYEAIRGGSFAKAEQELEKKITHEVTLYSDAKASAGRYGITDRSGNPVMHGRFFDNDNAGEQSAAELCAASKAVWLASKVKEAIGAEAIELNLMVDAQWLTYQDHGGQKGYKLTREAQRFGIKLNVQWISGTKNPADEYTVCSGYKKWSDNDLSSLAVRVAEDSEAEKAPF